MILSMFFGCLLTCIACGKHEHGEHEHGMPKDWRFSLARGDVAAGRELFVELECFKCHEVKGESFPGVAPEQKGIGPELAQMAGSHSVEFFAESIANPNAVIDRAAKTDGHVGADGRSLMPSYADILTVKQLSDVATYLDSLGSVPTNR
jgi:mono/diheme cytochrome c family protein